MKATANGTASGTANGGGRHTSGSGSSGYFAVAVLLITLVGLLYGGAWWLTRAAPARLSVTATSVLPTAVPTAVAGLPAASPTPARARPTSWTVTEMTDPQTGRTYYMAPPEVVVMVLDDYQEADRFFSEHTFDVTESDYSRFFSEPELGIALQSFRDARSRGEAHGRVQLVDPQLRILDFSRDGMTARVAEDIQGERYPIFDVQTRLSIREEQAPVGTGIGIMAFDRAAGRWKGSDSDFVESSKLDQ